MEKPWCYFARVHRGGSFICGPWGVLGQVRSLRLKIAIISSRAYFLINRAIRISWLCFAYPCLLLAYIGQAAFISVHPEAVSNPFFNTVPPGMYYPSLVLSVLAAVVASQAMITGSVQLISQCMSLSYFPKIKLVHTSSKFHGQVYIPLVNWLMMIGTIIVTAVYNNVSVTISAITCAALTP